MTVTVPRGTYGGNVCVKPASGNFASAVSVALSGTTFTLLPATLTAS